MHVQLSSPRQVLSSAVLNGGWVRARHILNLKVEKNIDGRRGPFEDSAITLEKYCRKMGWQGLAVGMMTAAGMESFRQVCDAAQGVEVTTLVTAGISNARRAGDPAECRDMGGEPVEIGTINIIVLTNARLTAAAMVEAVIAVTEAKSAALQDLGVTSPVTGAIATGTGTDTVAVVSGTGPHQIRYCGKHTLFGEMLASTTISAVTGSLQEKVDNTTKKREVKNN